MDDLNLNSYTSPGTQNPSLTPESFAPPSLPAIDDDIELIQDILTDAAETVQTAFPTVDYSDKIPSLPVNPESVLQGALKQGPLKTADPQSDPSNVSTSQKTSDVVMQSGNIKIDGTVSPKVANQQSLLAFLSSISESIHNLEQEIAKAESQGIFNSRARTLLFLTVGASQPDTTQALLVKTQLETLKTTSMQQTSGGPRLNLSEHPDIMLQLVKLGCLPPNIEGGPWDGSAKTAALAGTPPYDNPVYAAMALSQPEGWEGLSAAEVDQTIGKINIHLQLQSAQQGIGGWALGQTLGSLLPGIAALTLTDPQFSNMLMLRSQLTSLLSDVQMTRLGPRIILGTNPGLMFQLKMYGIMPPTISGGEFDGMAKKMAATKTPPYDNPLYAAMAGGLPDGWEELSIGELKNVISNLDFAIANRSTSIALNLSLFPQSVNPLVLAASLNMASGLDPINRMFLNNQINSAMSAIDRNFMIPWSQKQQIKQAVMTLITMQVISGAVNNQVFAKLNEDGLMVRSPFLMNHLSTMLNNFISQGVASQLTSTLGLLSIGGQLSNYQLRTIQQAVQLTSLGIALSPQQQWVLGNALNMISTNIPLNNFQRSVLLNAITFSTLQAPLNNYQQNVLRNALTMASIGLPLTNIQQAVIREAVGYAALNTLNTFQLGVVGNALNHIAFGLPLSNIQQAIVQEALNFVALNTPLNLAQMVAIRNALSLASIGVPLNSIQQLVVREAVGYAALSALNPFQQGVITNALNTINSGRPLNGYQQMRLQKALQLAGLSSPLNNYQLVAVANALSLASIGLPLNNLQLAVIQEAIGYAALSTLNPFQLGVVANALDAIAFGLPLNNVQQAIVQEALNFVALGVPLNNLQMVAIRNALSLSSVGLPLNNLQQMQIREAVGYAALGLSLNRSQLSVIANALNTINSGRPLNGYQQMRLQQALQLTGLQSPLNNYQLVAIVNALSLASIGLPLNNLQQAIIREAIGYAALNSALTPLQLSVIVNALDAIAFGLPLSDSQQAIVQEALNSATQGVPLNTLQMLGVRNALALAAILSPLTNLQNPFLSDVLERSFTGFALALNVMVSLGFKADLATVMQIVQELGLSNTNYNPIAQAALFLLSNQAFNWEAPTSTKAAIDLIAPDLLVKHNSDKQLEQLEALKAMLKALKALLASLLSGGGSPEEISKAYSQMGELMAKTGTDPNTMQVVLPS